MRGLYGGHIGMPSVLSRLSRASSPTHSCSMLFRSYSSVYQLILPPFWLGMDGRTLREDFPQVNGPLCGTQPFWWEVRPTPTWIQGLHSPSHQWNPLHSRRFLWLWELDTQSSAASSKPVVPRYNPLNPDLCHFAAAGTFPHRHSHWQIVCARVLSLARTLDRQYGPQCA